MLYVVKTIESFISPPGLFVLVLIVVGIIGYRRARSIGISAITVAIILYAASIPVVADACLRPLETAYTPPVHVTGDVIVMLGGGEVRGTPDIDGYGNPSGDAANRLLCTARLYRIFHVPIVLSGGPTYLTGEGPTSEAKIEARELAELGVPERQIYTENNSRTTEENAAFTKPILQAHHFTQPILVTSAFHMARSVLDFRRAGITVTPYPTDYQVSTEYGPDDFIWLPSADAFRRTSTAVHEYLGELASMSGLHG